MIIVPRNSQLRNQIFQYIMARKLYPDHRAVFINFSELRSAVDLSHQTTRTHWINTRQSVSFCLHAAFVMLIKLRLLGTIKEAVNEENYIIQKTRGLIPFIYVLRDTFFQNETLCAEINQQLNPKSENINTAQNWLANNTAEIKFKEIVFVNIRRGDYVSWPNRDYPAILDLEWYRNAMDKMGNKLSNPLFLIITDDPFYAADVELGPYNILISNNTSNIDLALMSLSDHGILSASTFAWWGAWFCRRRRNNTPTVFIAPQYWA